VQCLVSLRMPLQSRWKGVGEAMLRSLYLKHQANISKFQHGISPDGKVEVLQIEGLGIEKIQARQGEAQ